MKLNLKSALAAAATLGIVGAANFGFASAALAGTGGAATAPVWETPTVDPGAQGNITFYDASGNVITSGDIYDPTTLTSTSPSAVPLFSYAVASGAPTSFTGTKATLYFAMPDPNKATAATWNTQEDSAGSYSFPNSSAPGVLGTTSLPLAGPETVTNDGADLPSALGALPAASTTPGYANVIQVRMPVTAAGHTSISQYWVADLAYNTDTNTSDAPITVDGVSVAPNTWQQLYPQYTTTTTSVSAAPGDQQLTGSNPAADETLTATVSPSTATGTVQFYNSTGNTAVGSPQTVSGGSASTTITSPAVGSYSYYAVYTPAAGTDTVGSGSSADATSFTVSPAATGTTTTLMGPSSANEYSPVTYSATVSPAAAPGTVTFTAVGTGSTTGTTVIGTAPNSGGTADLNISQLNLAPGTYDVTAAFGPDDPTAYAPSSSSPAVALTVSAPACEGTPPPSTGTTPFGTPWAGTCSDTQNISVTVNPGSITITTPYTGDTHYTANPLTLNSSGTELQSSGRFPAATDPDILVTSTLAGDPNWTVSVGSSPLNCASGYCSTLSSTNGVATNGNYTAINAENVGLDGSGSAGGWSDTQPDSFSSTSSVTLNNIPAANGVAPDDNTPTLGLGQPEAFATSTGGGNGAVSLWGTLNINASPLTAAGTYTGTLTFTVG